MPQNCANGRFLVLKMKEYELWSSIEKFRPQLGFAHQPSLVHYACKQDDINGNNNKNDTAEQNGRTGKWENEKTQNWKNTKKLGEWENKGQQKKGEMGDGRQEIGKIEKGKDGRSGGQGKW
ncbi:hypothetical protein BDR05DRAFT_950508 [Suillus weaverae]|nr:hypothetical protein BDR05DRAFT_950508 [Suillus weaverae]